jgi:hypothetical protein
VCDPDDDDDDDYQKKTIGMLIFAVVSLLWVMTFLYALLG